MGAINAWETFSRAVLVMCMTMTVRHGRSRAVAVARSRSQAEDAPCFSACQQAGALCAALPFLGVRFVTRPRPQADLARGTNRSGTPPGIRTRLGTCSSDEWFVITRTVDTRTRELVQCRTLVSVLVCCWYVVFPLSHLLDKLSPLPTHYFHRMAVDLTTPLHFQTSRHERAEQVCVPITATSVSTSTSASACSRANRCSGKPSRELCHRSKRDPSCPCRSWREQTDACRLAWCVS